jgi:uncharacterized protein (DUF3084 family)
MTSETVQKRSQRLLEGLADQLQRDNPGMPRTTAVAKASVKKYSDFHRQERAERFAKLGY